MYLHPVRNVIRGAGVTDNVPAEGKVKGRNGAVRRQNFFVTDR